ncbi:hypothetical protein [Halobellus inordinatus]|nr:hypothetical protein [Halobellus ramosii]
MRMSSRVLLAGVLVFVIPLPGTFLLGGLVVALGGGLRLLGE